MRVSLGKLEDMTEFDRRLSLHDTAEVLHTSDVREVNSLLQAGWFLVDTYKSEYQPGSSFLMYALGWPRSQGVPIKPDQDALADLHLGE